MDAAKTRLKKAKAAETKSSVSSICLPVSNREILWLNNFKSILLVHCLRYRLDYGIWSIFLS